ncbi:MAG: AI-2E family transporter, partial [Planctomycetaceae bacterium]|nr:AI-2E family transporter [Planctomycetaceae bacterium]
MVDTLVRELPPRPALRILLTWASLIVIIAGLKAAAALVVPFLLSLFLAILCAPVLRWLGKRGLREPLATLIVICGLCLATLLLVIVMSRAFDQFFSLWPGKYEPRIGQLTSDWNAWIVRTAERATW